MTKTIEGTVTSTVQKEYSIDGLGQMVNTIIKVTDSEGTQVSASKHTKKSSNFSLPVGTEVKMTYDETDKVNQKGEEYVARKVTALVLLNQEKKGATTTGVTTTSSNKTEHKSNPVEIKTDWAARDLSIEVGMLLQAIISHHGLDGTTGNKLRTALVLKRVVAEESKEGSLKSTDPKETKVTTKTSKKAEVETDDDDAPFDLSV